jgi:hypothetical protein
MKKKCFQLLDCLYCKYIDIILTLSELFVQALVKGRIASLWRAFLSCFAASANELYISRQCTPIVYILQWQKPKTNAKLSKESRSKSRSNRFIFIVSSVNPRLYCYGFLPSLNMSEVPENYILVSDRR